VATLVIGLGNPGGEYANTRHNAGWGCLDVLERRGRFSRERRDGPARVREGEVEGFDIVLARPQTFMNLSGRAGRHLTDRLGIAPEEVVVVHDDLDLPFGRLRVRRNGGAAGQKGVLSLADAWRTQAFLRVRIGIGRPPDGEDATDHVLGRWTPEERERLPAVWGRAAGAVLTLIRRGLEPAMAEYNRVADV